jgi:glyoxylase-like metal-dependent hydrolase (beta-lactamase superfamily II)
VPDWTGFAVVPPHTVFDDEVALPGGILVRHVGGRHAEDSTVVAVPGAGVLLLGDCVYPPPLHLREPEDGVDTALAARLLAEYPGYVWYVGAHDEPLLPDGAAALASD